MTITKFTTKRCSACKVIEPIIDEFCRENNIEISSIDAEEDYFIADMYDVVSVPTMIFKNGSSSRTIVGPVTKEELAQMLRDM